MGFVRSGAVLAVSLVAVASCGGDDDAAPTSDAPPEVADDGADTAVVDDAAVVDGDDDTADDDVADDGGVEAVDDPPPAENTGTVSVDGFTYELAGDDFLLCETVNPAFDETINIQTKFDVDPDAVVINGDVIASRMELGVIGDLPDDVFVDAGDADRLPHEAESVEASRDGRTVSGTVTVVDQRTGASVTDDNPLEDTTIEFSFTC